MDFNELLEKRRSVRDYEEREVPLELIQELIQDCIKAPNAGNMQLWRFIIINNKDFMLRISDACKQAVLAEIEKNPNSPMKGYQDTLSKKEHNVFYNAPAVVYFVGSAKGATIPMDCSLAASYFMLAAASKGLGTCWVAQGAMFQDKALSEEIGLPENYRIVAPIILGYPKTIPDMVPRKEPKILKIIT
jgi:nitroreductase